MDTFTTSTTHFGRVTMAGLILLAASCGGQEEGEPAADGMGDMPGMAPAAGEAVADTGGDLLDQMSGHLERMANMPADSLASVLPTHRQMVANMLAQMNREMAAMAMPADSAWTATVDSLRSDLTGMPGMDLEALSTLMPGHRQRVARLMEMHAVMTRRMGM